MTDVEERVLSNLGLAREAAWRFVGRQHIATVQLPGGETWDDLFQTACEGLVKAARRFRPELGVAFSSYAVPMIAGEIRRRYRDSRPGGLHLTRSQFEAKARPQVASLDAPVEAGDGGEPVRAGDILPSGDDVAADTEARLTVEEWLSQVPDARAVMALRLYIDGWRQTEIAASLGVSQMSVSRLLRRAAASIAARLGRPAPARLMRPKRRGSRTRVA